MKKIALILLILLCFNSCKSSKKIVSKKSEPIISTETESIERSSVFEKNLIEESTISSEINNSKSDVIINYAKQFDGVNYKYGGTTKKGMDCSGLVSTAFKSEAILLPRSSKEMATIGNQVDVKEVEKGDLLFFSTKANSREINHVGLVTDVRPGYIEFIHATTSAGVIISNLAERFWHSSFVQARRIL